jgi:Ankyrin repeats (3 copies)
MIQNNTDLKREIISQDVTCSRRLSNTCDNNEANDTEESKTVFEENDAVTRMSVERALSSPMTLLLDTLDKLSPPGKCTRTFCSLQMHDVFEEWTDDQTKSYAQDVIKAVRAQDIQALRKWKEEGRILQAANRFGESLLHMACRRGFTNVVEFFIEEAGLNLWIRDDFGRTPLHDACWTSDPAPELVKYIIDKEPDMLLVSDKRGHTPLEYVRKDDWKTWTCFLEGMDMSRLLPQRECFYAERAKGMYLEECGTIVIDEMMSQIKL